MYTHESIVDLIYGVDADVRRRSVFVCDHNTAADLRKITDEDGLFLMQGPYDKTQQPRLLGYTVRADRRYSGLAFGEFPELPREVTPSYIAQDVQPNSDFGPRSG